MEQSNQEPSLVDAIAEALATDRLLASSIVHTAMIKGLFVLLHDKGILSKEEIITMIEERKAGTDENLQKAFKKRLESPEEHDNPEELEVAFKNHTEEILEIFDAFKSGAEKL